MLSDERPHVLYLIDVLYSTAGGAEGILAKIVRRLPQQRYRCSIATLASRPELVDADGFRCPVHKLPIRRLWDAEAIRVAWRLARLIRSEKVSILHTFFEASDILGAVVGKLSGCPAVVSSRRDMGFKRTRVHRLAYRLLAPLYDQVHAVADEVRRTHILHDGLSPKKVITLRNGVDLDEIDAAVPCPRREMRVPSGAPLVVSVGNVRPVKGVEHLIRTAQLVCRERPDTRFLVVGLLQDERYARRVKALADELGVSGQVVFAGCRLDVAAILKNCDVFYLPSLSEGLSNALLEAMACSLPCVAARVGGNPEAVEEGVSGYLTPAGDQTEAAQRILELLGDRRRILQMGVAGRRIVEERFSVASMIDSLVDSYDGLLNRFSRPCGHPSLEDPPSARRPD